MRRTSAVSTSPSNELISRVQEALRLISNERRAEAVMIYESVAQQVVDDFAVNLQLGHLCCALAEVEKAIKHYETALKHRPDDAICLMHIANVYEMGGQSDVALTYFTESLEINDDLADAHSGKGAILMRLGRFPDAKEHLERAHSLKPSDAYVLANLALTWMRLDDHELAQTYAEKAIKASGAKPDALFTLVQVLTESGQIDEAIRQCEKIIRVESSYGGAYDFLARLKKFSKSDKSFIERTEKVLKKSMNADQRYAIHYALGKIYDDCEEWSQAIEHYHKANLLQKGDFDTKQETRYVKATMRTFDTAAIKKYRAFGNPSDQPVFIVGMPRSGTTLMEQMIATHSEGAAAGELPDMPRIAKEILPIKNQRGLLGARRVQLDRDAIQEHATAYLVALREGRESARRIVDKLPGNFLNLGLIAILFPNARVIHALRHPLDACLSCYFQNFGNIRWANEFDTIIYAYRKYREIMAHWKRILPAEMISDISYERLVEEPATEGRRMLEACGLEWDDSILEFHGKERKVKTASVWQVRQPIYQSSKKRWENYAPHIGDLAEGLAEYLLPDHESLKAAGIAVARPPGPGWFRKFAR
jgi:tetratricopeptide (TPR) repeat protein